MNLEFLKALFYTFGLILAQLETVLAPNVSHLLLNVIFILSQELYRILHITDFTVKTVLKIIIVSEFNTTKYKSI